MFMVMKENVSQCNIDMFLIVVSSKGMCYSTSGFDYTFIVHCWFWSLRAIF